jgi:hypothetical protein
MKGVKGMKGMKKSFMAAILFVDLGFQGATITGTVVDARTMQPLRGAIVIAPRVPVGKPEGLINIGFRTGEDGKFILRGVAPGIVNFSVFKAGYPSGPFTSIRPASDGERIDNVILTVPFGATLSGQISDESGQPVAGTQVAVRAANQPAGARPAQPMLRGAATTTEDGRYVVGGLAAGDYTIMVGSLDDTAEIISLGSAAFLNLPPDSSSGVQAKPVTVSAGEVRDDMDLVIRFRDRFAGPRPLDYGNATIQGRVVDDSGIGIAQAPVLLRQDTKGGGSVVTRTNASGHFRFERVPDGEFVIGPARAGMPVFDGVGQTVTLQIAAGSRNENVLIATRRGGTISGTVTDDFGDPALAAVIVSPRTRTGLTSVYMSNVAPQMLGGATGTDVHGRYRILRLPPGEYVVSAIAGDLPTARAEVHFTDETGRDRILPPGPTFYPGVPTVAQATRIGVRENRESTGVDVTVRPLLMTSIGVTLAASRPIGEVQLDLFHDDALPMLERTVRTSERSVTLDARPGRYRLVASAEAPASADPIVRLWSTADVYADLANPASVTMTLEPGANLSGRIAFDGKESNRQNAGAWVVPTDPLRTSSTTGNAVLEPATGLFTMEGIMPARYMLYAGGAERGRSPWMLKSATVNGRDVLDEPIDLRAGDDITDVRITVTDRITELLGTVLDAAGKPAADAGWVVAFSTDKKHWWPGSRRLRAVRPGENGTYRIRALAPGQYAVAILPETIGEAELIAKLPVLATDGVQVALAEGERKVQDLRAPRK